ncbi:MAG TPA: cation:proton antiporter [Pirellulales bacterium]|jgi:CPA2 family monovalent cation:H+ antiporter-2|nr:cation:proton antiporter [Pirellulales bacterium]
MHEIDLILTLTAGLAVALVFGYVTHRIGLSPIVGYLLAGVAVGPHTPGFVADQPLAEQLAEIGVVLLMFGVGLQFHWKELLAVRRVAVPGALVQSAVATILGALVAHAFGWGWTAGIVFGMAISVASTVVLLRVLSDNHDLHTRTGHIAVGWLVVEDLFTVVMLVMLPAMFVDRAEPAHIALAVGLALVKVAALVVVTVVIGGRVIPWLLTRAALSHSRELFTLTVLVVALGVAVSAAKVFGVSMALGAFLGGMIVGRSEFSFRAASEALPMRDAFAVLFFVSIGLLFDPAALLDAPGILCATLGIILLGKPAAALALTLICGYSLEVATGVAVALAQIGEFSFLLVFVARDLGVLDAIATNTIIAAAIISISLNPLLYRAIGPSLRWLEHSKALRRWRAARPIRALALSDTDDADSADARHRAVLVGYGPVGRTVARLLKENDVRTTVIDLNLPTVQALKREGVDAIYGDAGNREVLQAAAIDRAGSFVLSASNLPGANEVIRLAKQLNPKIRVLARAVYVNEIAALKSAGADVVFSGEGEVALAFTVAVLDDLGATRDQIDRERERVRRELFGRRTTPPPSESAAPEQTRPEAS